MQLHFASHARLGPFEGLRSPLVAAADLDGDGAAEFVVAAGRDLKLFGRTRSSYALRWRQELPESACSLAAGMLSSPSLAVGMRDRVVVFQKPGADEMERLETLEYPEADFRQLALGDLDGDGRQELLAVSAGARTLYVFRPSVGEGKQLEEVGRLYVSGLERAALAAAEGGTSVAAATGDGFVDIFVPCALVSAPDQRVVIVRRGDSIWRMARRYRTGVDDIARANALTPPFKLAPGQALVIPVGTRGR